VHQLPSALGVTSKGGGVVPRLTSLWQNLGHVSGWSLALALGTLLVLLVGERINARLPWALGAIAVATVLTVALSLDKHGVKELGAVSVGLPTWRPALACVEPVGSRRYDRADAGDRDTQSNRGDVTHRLRRFRGRLEPQP